MPTCKVCGIELTKDQKSTCSIECRGKYVKSFNVGKPSKFKGMIGRWTDEQRLKIGASQLGRKMSEGNRKRQSDRMKGIAFFKGHKHTEEWKKDMSERVKKTKPWEKGIKKRTKHGEGNASKRTAEYGTWIAIKQRCYNINLPEYKNYGGRGIIVCDRWIISYNNFLEDMGRRPIGKYSIDRINNDGNYEPNNCRWATPKQQYENTRLQRGANGQFI